MSLLTTLNHLADQVTAPQFDDPPCNGPLFDDHHLSCSTARALVNLALLLAKGDANKYTQVIEGLYLDNGLRPPDFSRYIEQQKLEVTLEPFEDDISFMTELDGYLQNEYPQTAFTNEYYALYPHDIREFEDWFDYDSSDESLLNDTSYLDEEERRGCPNKLQEDAMEYSPMFSEKVDSYITQEHPIDDSQGSNFTLQLSPIVQSSNCNTEYDLTTFDFPWLSMASDNEL